MISITNALLAAAALAVLADPASAQTEYYAREKITGLKGQPAEQQQVSCAPFVAKKYPILNNGATGNVKLADKVTTVTAAQGFCDAKAAISTEPAWCGHYAGNSQVWWYPKSKSSLKDYPTISTFYAADCS